MEPEQGPIRAEGLVLGLWIGLRESETLDREVIRVSFLTQDSGLGDAFARALGEDEVLAHGEWRKDASSLRHEPNPERGDRVRSLACQISP